MVRLYRVPAMGLPALLLVLVGCRKADLSEPRALAVRGEATAAHAKALYLHLGDEAKEEIVYTWRRIEPDTPLPDRTLDAPNDPNKAALEANGRAYAARAQAAGDLESLYQGLGKIVDKGQTDAAKTAADGLVDSLGKVIETPIKVSGVEVTSDDLKGILGDAVEAIQTARQKGEFNKSAKAMLTVVDAFDALTARESGLYRRQIVDSENARARFMEWALLGNLLDPEPLPPSQVAGSGMVVKPDLSGAKPAYRETFGRSGIVVSRDARIAGGLAEIDGTIRAVGLLKKTHHEYVEGRPKRKDAVAALDAANRSLALARPDPKP